MSAHTTTGSNSYQQDDYFWFEDGTVVLQVENTAFKVYARPLVEHSPVFRDMLSLPQPGPSQASAQPSLQYVTLQGDSALDVKDVLEVLMPFKTLHAIRFEDPDFVTIAAWIRIGHKYQIESLVEQALRHLRKFYPRDFAGFSRRSRYDDKWCSLVVVNLARLTGANDLLPIALLDCCQLSGEELVAGAHVPGRGHVELSRADLALCITAIPKLVEERVRVLEASFNPTCQNARPDCEDFLLDELWARDQGNDPILLLCTSDPLQSLAETIDKRVSRAVCERCCARVRGRADQEQQMVFDLLPELFGIEVAGWNE